MTLRAREKFHKILGIKVAKNSYEGVGGCNNQLEGEEECNNQAKMPRKVATNKFQFVAQFLLEKFLLCLLKKHWKIKEQKVFNYLLQFPGSTNITSTVSRYWMEYGVGENSG